MGHLSINTPGAKVNGGTYTGVTIAAPLVTLTGVIIKPND